MLSFIENTTEATRFRSSLDLRGRPSDNASLTVASTTVRSRLFLRRTDLATLSFDPAAKVARREGVEFILDPMWQSVEDDLLEHVDGLTSSLDAPDGGNNLTVSPEAD